jgi:fatty acid desaturase
MTAGIDGWNPFAGLGFVLEADEEAISAHDVVRRERSGFIESPRNVTTEVRESVSRPIQAVFPRAVSVPLEAAVTWMSGCPHKGQQPLYRRTRLGCTLEAFLGFGAAVACGYVIVDFGLWYLLPIQWIILVGRTWAVFNIFHHATHDTLFQSSRANRAIAFVGSLISFSSSLDSYRAEHIRSHHTRAMCTYDDQEAPFMSLGFRPGLAVSYYEWRLAWLILTPWTYILYTRYRLWDWQKSEPIARRIAVWGFAIALLGSAVGTGTLRNLLFAYVIPLFAVFNVTGVLGSLSEHHWGTLLYEAPKTRLVLLQQSRFLLDPAPSETRTIRRLAGWAIWLMRALCYHLPVRIAVLPGDSINHDHHHRHPKTDDWPQSTYERFDHIDGDCPGFNQYPHTHAWTLGEAIARVFDRMSRAPYNAAQPDPKGEEKVFQAIYRKFCGGRVVAT